MIYVVVRLTIVSFIILWFAFGVMFVANFNMLQNLSSPPKQSWCYLNDNQNKKPQKKKLVKICALPTYLCFNMKKMYIHIIPKKKHLWFAWWIFFGHNFLSFSCIYYVEVILSLFVQMVLSYSPPHKKDLQENCGLKCAIATHTHTHKQKSLTHFLSLSLICWSMGRNEKDRCE